jgi:hypothetical protein
VLETTQAAPEGRAVEFTSLAAEIDNTWNAADYHSLCRFSRALVPPIKRRFFLRLWMRARFSTGDLAHLPGAIDAADRHAIGGAVPSNIEIRGVAGR